MYQVMITLACGHYNTITIESPAFRPQVGTIKVCRICGQKAEVKYSGNPFSVADKKKRLP